MILNNNNNRKNNLNNKIHINKIMIKNQHQYLRQLKSFNKTIIIIILKISKITIMLIMRINVKKN